MNLILSIVSFNFMLSLVLSFIAIYITKKKMMSREKSSPFECGFDPKNNSRIPFSMRFFLITVIFLVFDVEIILLLPYLVSSSISSDVFGLMSAVAVVVILVIGTLHEWKQGSLKWTVN
uniref:NADH-ubiquinone oxidoreductase chain 3 n=1 Tax=Enoplochiton echinatus TaxID=3244015 RepID=A0A6H1PGC7_9MOLL|nr:NADH dehydrogenase subunit 3 [Acanthopleura echinata]